MSELEHPGDAGLQNGSEQGTDGDAGTSQTGDTQNAELATLKEENAKLAKQVADKEVYEQRLQGERDQARSDASKTQEELLKRVVAVQEAQISAGSAPMSKAEVIKHMEEEGAEFTFDFLHNVIGETASKQEIAEIRAENKKLAEAFEAMQGMTKAEISNLKLEPRMQKHRELVEQLGQDERFAGLGRDVQLAIAEKVAEARGPTKPERDQLPGGGGSERVLDDGRSIPGGIDPDKLAELERRMGSKLSDRELQHHKRTGALA